MTAQIMAPRTSDELADARTALVPFARVGYRLILLSSTAKKPIEKGWQQIDYRQQIPSWLERGGNIGVLLGDDDIVLDVDPRNGGLESLERLQRDLGIDLSSFPTVLSGRGDGGRHIYMKKPVALRVRKNLKGYPGLDIKTKGGFVLGPASRHPETGGVYRPDPSTPSISKVSEAPAPLLDALRRCESNPRVRRGGGELSVDDLKLVLSALDPAEYGEGNYAGWIRIAAACHDATNGEGLEVWLDWAAKDDRYADEVDYDRNIATWECFKAGRVGGASVFTLLNEVARAGRLDIADRLRTRVSLARFEKEPLNFDLHPETLTPEDFEGGISHE